MAWISIRKDSENIVFNVPGDDLYIYRLSIASQRRKSVHSRWDFCLLRLKLLSQFRVSSENRRGGGGGVGVLTKKISEKVRIIVPKHSSKSQTDWKSIIDASSI